MKIGVLSFFSSFIVIFAFAAQAEVWELGYTKPVVEEIPTSVQEQESSIEGDASVPADLNGSTRDAVLSAESSVKSTDLTASTSKGFSNVTKISTSKNTYGVETVESPGIKVFLSPVAGLNSLLGNSNLNVAPQYSFGGRLGVLLSGSLMIEAGYTYSVLQTSAPTAYSIGYQPDNVFESRQSNIDAGVKLFFLGRESRLRPFVGASFGLANSRFNYSATYQMFMGGAEDLMIKQFLGMGQLGAEFAITRNFVATAAFGVNGVLASSVQTSLNEMTASGLEASRLQAGNSLSRSAAYQGTLGVGLYF